MDQSYTFIINCTAIGVPTPEIVWRLNWGHVPDKCRMTNQAQGGNKIYGELTCTDAQKEDSGTNRGKGGGRRDHKYSPPHTLYRPPF